MRCGILVTVMHEYSPEFFAAFNRVLVVKDGRIYEKGLTENV